MKINYFVISLCLVMALCSRVNASGPGTTSANFLKLGAGARPAGMGGAFAASADDINALYWNPAGLALVDSPEAGLTHNDIGEGLRLEAAAFAMPVKRLKGSLAAGFTMFTVDGIQGYDAGGAKTGTLGAYDKQITFGYGLNLAPGFSAGLALKAITEKLDSYEASACAGDAGLLYRLGPAEQRFPGGVTLGLTLRNAGTAMKFIEESSSLPSILCAAAAYETTVWGGKLITELDYNRPNDNDAFCSAGAEYSVNDLVCLRLGYETKDDLAGGMRAGVGFKAGNLGLDYAFLPRGEFGAGHRLSLTLKLGRDYAGAIALDKIEKQFRRGVRYYGKGDLVNAHGEFRKVLLVAPGHKGAKEYLARSEIRIAEVEDIKGVREHLAAGERYYRQGRLGDAQAEFDSVLAATPGNKEAADYTVKIKAAMKTLAETAFQRGVKQYEGGEYAKSLETMNEVLVLDPEHAGAKEYSSLGGEKLGRVEKLKIKLREDEEKLKAESERAAAYNEGIIHFEQKNWKQAALKFGEAAVRDPSDEKTAEYLARARAMVSAEYLAAAKKAYAGGRLAEALEQLKGSLSYQPGNREAGILRGEIIARQAKDNTEKAFVCNKEALRAYSGGGLGKAIELWKKALELDPGMDEARISLERAEKENRK
jgi:tetratricopeptide (TPR) repeat protein